MDEEAEAANRVGREAVDLGFVPGTGVKLVLPPLMIAAVDELAEREGRERADMLRLLISDGLLVHQHVLDHEGGTR